MSIPPNSGEKNRHFLPDSLVINSWESIRPYFYELENRTLQSAAGLEKWLKDRSELTAVLGENLAWRYIKMNCNTEDEGLSNDFNHFVTNIEPEIARHSNILDEKLVTSAFLSQLDKEKYRVLIRSVKRRMELFRKENIPLLAEVQVDEQEYGKISSLMTVKFRGEELTLQKAGNFLKEPESKVREKVFLLINRRRFEDAEKLHDLFSRLFKKRHQIAQNADYENFRDYKFSDLGRFDYTIKDCENFHHSIAKEVCPIVEHILDNRRKSLDLRDLRPWDLEVDPELKAPLSPFSSPEELINRTMSCLRKIHPGFGELLQIMNRDGYLDLDSRKGKAPGGFNYPLYESNIPFIFMNATGNQRDLETIMHESGHAIHSFLSKDLDLVDFKDLPSEVAELASMSMELISMDTWDEFYSDKDELKRARKSHLEGIIRILPWIAAVDKFQHQIYLHPDHEPTERNDIWVEVFNEFDTGQVNWKGLEKFREIAWQKQLHIFEIPFYYIEYGIAQLGAIAIWRNFRNDPEKALDAYMNALSLGYSVTIPQVYETAGIPFDFSKEYVYELMQFVLRELELLES